MQGLRGSARPDPLHLYVSDQQIADCDGKTDGEACGSGSGSQCYNGACLLAGCGNQIPDPGEVCDDGNHVAGDGLSPDCRSDEQCGNGYVNSDLPVNNATMATRSRATAVTVDARAKPRCGPELPSPQRLSGAHLAYDSARDVVVMFGGNNGSATPSELWSSMGACGSYDRSPGRMAATTALFPIQSGGGPCCTATHSRTTPGSGMARRGPRLLIVMDPGPRAKAAMAAGILPAQGIVLFGGTVTSSVWFNDTWTAGRHDVGADPISQPAAEQTRTRRTTSRHRNGAGCRSRCDERARGRGAQRRRIRHADAFDPGSRRAPASARSPGIWSRVPSPLSNNVKTGWASGTGSKWTSIAPAVTFGGESPLATLGDATRWSRGTPVAIPTGDRTTDAAGARSRPRHLQRRRSRRRLVTYDMIRRRAVWIRSFSSPTDVWSYDGGWESYPAAPASFEGACAAYDPVRDRIVVFGGALTEGDTWTVDAATLTDWQLESPPTSPST